ncbi:MAG TPA: ATP-binding protein, partial [Candidatus Polarisedimenticolaceae bacterium]|nr:ATP-binding protein [Candidatus Polarisedimenticolaceae bacterium]
LDVMMPQMTGHEVCRALKGDPATRLCQVMLVTALDRMPDQVTGLDTGADDYLSKPVRREEFLAKVRALLRARHLLGELERARDELARRNEELQLKKTLAQTLVHDLKSPLSAVLGNLDLLHARSDEALHHMIDRSKQGARRMLRMILDLLDVEALEEGRIRPSIERVELTELARASADEAATPAEQRQIEIVMRVDGPVWATADPLLTRRVIDNLLSNAMSHSPTGGFIELQVGYREEGAEIVVSDQGPGVPEQLREHVFDKYAQVRSSEPATATTNRGLGLTFCRLVVEAQGGSIWIESSPAGGACFRTVLPAAARLADELPVDLAAGRRQ